MKKLLVFDLDDTLLDTSDLYWKVKEEFIQFIYKEGNDKDELRNQFEKIDTANMKEFGFSPIRYRYTMSQMFQAIFGSVSQSEQDKIFQIANRIYSEVPRVIEGAIPFLDWAKDFFTIALLTRGEERLQRYKIDQRDLQKYFNDRIQIVDFKDEFIYREFINSLGFNCSDCTVIGDSIKSDINPALKIGATAILYQYTHHSYHWLQEHDAQPFANNYLRIVHLNQLKDLLISNIKM